MYSIVVPHVKGFTDQELGKFLKHVLSNINLPEEIVFVCDGPSVNFPVKSRVLKRYPIKVTVLFNDKNSGVGFTRGRGNSYLFANKKNEFVLQMDDDSFPFPLAIDALLETAKTSSKFGIIGSMGANKKFPYFLGKLHPVPYWNVGTSCALISRKVYQDVGNMDPKFRTFDDIELCFRVWMKDMWTCFIPYSVTNHVRSHTPPGAWEKEAIETFHQKHGDKVRIRNGFSVKHNFPDGFLRSVEEKCFEIYRDKLHGSVKHIFWNKEMDEKEKLYDSLKSFPKESTFFYDKVVKTCFDGVFFTDLMQKNSFEKDSEDELKFRN